jgi:GTP cyclohydrolase IA
MPQVDFDKLVQAGTLLLEAIGEDPNRDGLKDTPQRYAKWWREFIDYDAGKIETSFTLENNDEVVAVVGMKVWSLCEHHLLPFSATVSVGYIPNEKVLGLSKFARIAHKHAHKPQVQERMVQEIADELERVCGTKDIAVVADGEHSCMVMRGIKTTGNMRTSVMRGAFRAEHETRAEFLNLVAHKH